MPAEGKCSKKTLAVIFPKTFLVLVDFSNNFTYV